MKLIRSLYFWILIAIIGGCLFGLLSPKWAVMMEPLGLNFIKLIKAFIGPIIFLTVATGIAQTGSVKKLGKISFKAILYFEVLSTIALLIGWIAGSLFKPGAAVHADLQNLDLQQATHFIANSETLSFIGFLQNLIPSSIVEPFFKGDILQILVLAILFGVALLALGESRSKNLVEILSQLTKVLFNIIRMIMYIAPLAVFGGMAFTFGKFGGAFLLPLLGLIATFYTAGIIFVLLVLGGIARLAGFSIFQFLKYMLP